MSSHRDSVDKAIGFRIAMSTLSTLGTGALLVTAFSSVRRRNDPARAGILFFKVALGLFTVYVPPCSLLGLPLAGGAKQEGKGERERERSNEK